MNTPDDERGGCSHDATPDELAAVEAMPARYGADEYDAEWNLQGYQ